MSKQLKTSIGPYYSKLLRPRRKAIIIVSGSRLCQFLHLPSNLQEPWHLRCLPSGSAVQQTSFLNELCGSKMGMAPCGAAENQQGIRVQSVAQASSFWGYHVFLPFWMNPLFHFRMSGIIWLRTKSDVFQMGDPALNKLPALRWQITCYVKIGVIY